MIFKYLTLSAVASSILMAASPMVSTSMSTDNGGTKLAIDAYSDGGGVLMINQAGDTKFDNSTMNKLVFKYGDAAKSSNTTLKNQVNVLSPGATALEKADASSKLELAKIAINPPVNGVVCDDGDQQTIEDKWLNGLCRGNNVENQLCDDTNAQTINDKYHNGVCAGINVEGLICDDTVAQTINDQYHNGICVGTNVEGQNCIDSVSYTYADKYTAGVCSGVVAKSCKDIKALAPTSTTGIFTINPSTSLNVYCDMTTDGGGWTLIGKGREGWTFANSGQGDVNTIASSPSTNTVAAMSASTVNAILGKQLNAAIDGVVINRLDGLNQRIKWKYTSDVSFAWDFDVTPKNISIYINGTYQVTSTTNDNLSNTGLNDCSRVFTWAWTGHSLIKGFSTGSTCINGWQYSTEGHAIPMTNVWIRN